MYMFHNVVSVFNFTSYGRTRSVLCFCVCVCTLCKNTASGKVLLPQDGKHL